MKPSIFLSLMLSLCFSNCKNVHYLSPSEDDRPQLVFGSGGGFAGSYTEYVLCANGQLFRRSSVKSSYEEVERVDKNATGQAFANYQKLRVADMTINDPGNLYYFVHYGQADDRHKVVWGGVQQAADPKLKLYYQSLMSLTNDKNPIR